jgi:hypothetical protein
MPPRFFLLSAVALLAGCSSLPGARPAPITAPGAAVATVQAELLASYVSAMQTVVQGSPAEQAEVLAAARDGHEQARQGPATLRYALLLAAPGHAARDPQSALRLLQETLAHPELLTPIERALAIVEKARVEQELGLASENARLVAEAKQEQERQRGASATAALARQLRAEQDESARLKKELEEAKAKLEAIANIERSTTARPPANEGRK